jgi:hypothetical protein
MERSSVIERLCHEFGYSAQGARLIVDKLDRLDGEILFAFQRWWQDGTLPDYEAEGYTIERLMTGHGMNPIAAFLTLDWLVREPEKALISLRKGHDRLAPQAGD